MKKDNTTNQLVPPHSHRANIAARVIQNFLAYFKAGLASLHSNFPINEWDRLLPQAFMTLNMLRQSRINPKISSYTHLFGEFDFNCTPLAPPGTTVTVHSKPTDRGTWDRNRKIGYYVGPGMNHYRCFKCFIPKPRTEIITDTVVFIPHQIPIPSISLSDFICQATSDIITLLTCPPKKQHPTYAIERYNKKGSPTIIDNFKSQYSNIYYTRKTKHNLSCSCSCFNLKYIKIQNKPSSKAYNYVRIKSHLQ